MRDSIKNQTSIHPTSYLFFLLTSGLILSLALLIGIGFSTESQRGLALLQDQGSRLSEVQKDQSSILHEPPQNIDHFQQHAVANLRQNNRISMFPSIRQAAETQRKIVLPMSALAISGTLHLTKTVGTETSTCSDSSEIYVPSGTDIYYCYQVENQTDTMLDIHALADNSLPEQTVSYTYTLLPGQITTTILGPINVTGSVVGIDGSAIWNAFGQGETISATSAAEVYLTQPELTVSSLLIPKVSGTRNNECESAASIMLEVPKGMTIQHCLVIKNTGNRTLQSITVNAPAIGLNQITLPNRQIAPGGEYRLTPAEINNLGVPADSIIPGFEQTVSAPQETVFTATGQTPELITVSATATSTLSISDDSIAVELDVQAGTRAGQCDDTAVRVSSGTEVYFCFSVINSGSLGLSNLSVTYTQPQGGTQNISSLAGGERFVYDDKANIPVRVIAVLTGSVTLTGQVLTEWGSVNIREEVKKEVGIVPPVNEILTPLPTLTFTPVTAGPTATNTRRPPLNTVTPFPSFTPTITLTPSPRPMPPTHTAISPLPTPTATPTNVIVRGVISPTPVPSPTPTQTLVSTQTPIPTPTATPVPAPLVPQLPVTPEDQLDPSDELNSAQSTPDQTALAQRQLAANSTLVTAEQVAELLPTETEEEVIIPTVLPTATIEVIAETATPDSIGNAGNRDPAVRDQNDEPLATEAAESVSNTYQETASRVDQPRSVQMASPALLFAARVIDSALAAAAWIWFLCGSFIFFGVAGLIAGLYFRQQEKNRFALINQNDPFNQLGLTDQPETNTRASMGNTHQPDRQTSIYEAPIVAPDMGPSSDVELSLSELDSMRNSPETLERFSPASSKPLTPQDARKITTELDDDEHWPASLP